MMRFLRNLTHHPDDAGMLANIVLAILATLLFAAVVMAATSAKGAM